MRQHGAALASCFARARAGGAFRLTGGISAACVPLALLAAGSLRLPEELAEKYFVLGKSARKQFYRHDFFLVKWGWSRY